MVQIPAQSVTQAFTQKIKTRAVNFVKLHVQGSGDIGNAIKLNAAALAQLLADMLFYSKDSAATADGTNVQIFLTATYTPEFMQAHNTSPTHLQGEDVFIVHQGRRLYRYEYS